MEKRAILFPPVEKDDSSRDWVVLTENCGRINAEILDRCIVLHHRGHREHGGKPLLNFLCTAISLILVAWANFNINFHHGGTEPTENTNVSHG